MQKTNRTNSYTNIKGSVSNVLMNYYTEESLKELLNKNSLEETQDELMICIHSHCKLENTRAVDFMEQIRKTKSKEELIFLYNRIVNNGKAYKTSKTEYANFKEPVHN